MRNLRLFVSIIGLIFLVGSCFKDSPKNDMFRVAGTWKVTSIESTRYDTLGNVQATTFTPDFGFLMLNHVDNFLFEGTFSYDFSQGDTSFTSPDSYLLYLFEGGLGCDTWSVSKGAKSLNLASMDPETNFVTFLYAATIVNLTGKNMDLIAFTRFGNGELSTKEIWSLTRATH